MTSGCFDILHRGHIAYLNAAKALGDVLVVGLNSDDSVRRAKGESRPINPLEDRANVLAGLSCVDHIIAFDEDTPAELLGALRSHHQAALLQSQVEGDVSLDASRSPLASRDG